MKTVILYKGLPASGKTMWAKELISKNPGQYKRINKDELRQMLDNSHWSKHNEQFIVKVRDLFLLEALTNGKNVIIDDTNLHPKHEKNIKQLIKKYNADYKDNVVVEVKFFDVNVNECIKRDLKRQNSVGEKVIKDMYNQFIRSKVEKIVQDRSLPSAIIVDIDGTLAEKGDRSPFDWKRVGEDTVKEEIREIVNKNNDYKIIIFSGRDGVCEVETRDWLHKNKIYFDLLYMRPEGNNEKDVIIKQRMYEEHVKNKYYVQFILDDRLQVCRLWHSLGLTLLRVGDPDADF